MDIWGMIQQYVNIVAFFVALLLTEIFRRFVPGAAEDGKFANRILPFVPLILGMIVMGLQTAQLYPLGWAMQGLISGAFAAYVYRAFKVTILGD